MPKLHELSLAELVKNQANLLPDFVVLRFVHLDEFREIKSETRSFAELWQNSQSLAATLSRLGVKGNIALLMNNHPELVEGMIASSILAIPFVPIDPGAMGEKLAYMLSHTDCEGLICADYCLDQVLTVCSKVTSLRWILCVNNNDNMVKGGFGIQLLDYHQELSIKGSLIDIVDRAGEAPMFMMFTSGTTGNPKAVVYSQAQYMSMADSLQKLGVDQQDVLYTGLSLTHINAQNFLRNGLAFSIPTVISRKFTKGRLWDICRRYECTVFSLLGGMIPEVYAVPSAEDDADNPVRLILTSGMPAHLWRDFEKRFSVSLFEGYGATEGGSLGNPPGVGPVGSIGKPGAEWEAEILNEQGQVCALGVEGEICFRRRDGKSVAVSYYKNSAASSDKVRHGWQLAGRDVSDVQGKCGEEDNRGK